MTPLRTIARHLHAFAKWADRPSGIFSVEDEILLRQAADPHAARVANLRWMTRNAEMASADSVRALAALNATDPRTDRPVRSR